MHGLRRILIILSLTLATFSQGASAKSAGSDNKNLIASGESAALWGNAKGRDQWTQAVLEEVRSRLGQLERARDIGEFCPDYHRSSQSQKEACWLRLVSGVTFFESGFNPAAAYRESNGRYSIGLLSLSSGECREAPSRRELKDPLRNLHCGMRMMADLIERDGVIESAPPRRGAAAYWSVLRRPYGKGKHRHGKRDRLILLTQRFQELTLN